MSRMLIWLIGLSLFFILLVAVVSQVPSRVPVAAISVSNVSERLSVFQAPIAYLRSDVVRDVEAGTASPSIAESGSVVFLLLSVFFSAILWLLHESSWLLLLNWYCGITAFNIGKHRKTKNSITIRSSVTTRPVAGAEIAVIKSGKITSTYCSDSYGRVFLNWPNEEQKVKLRVSRLGYRSEFVVLDAELEDIPLEPLVHGLTFHVAHTLKVAHVTALLVGTALFAPIILKETNSLVLLTLIGYLVLWIAYLRSSIRPFHLVQVVDSQTRQPIVHAKVISCHKDSVLHMLSDENGLLRVPYPIPERVMLAKPGFTSVTQVIPMSAVSSDILIVTMRPVEA